MTQMIGTPYGTESSSNRNSIVGEAASHYVSEGSTRGYMQGFMDHYRAKSMSTADIRRVEEGRAEAGDGILEGNPDKENCCVRDSSMSGIGGIGTCMYICRETCEGDCKWRACAEPSTVCMYRFDHRVNIKDGRDVHACARSILIHACTREEAKAEADNAVTDNDM